MVDRAIKQKENQKCFWAKGVNNNVKEVYNNIFNCVMNMNKSWNYPQMLLDNANI